MGAFNVVAIGSGDTVSPGQHPPGTFEQRGFGFAVFLASRKVGSEQALREETRPAARV